MQDEARASLEDLAIRWETPRGRELKELVLQDARQNKGRGIAEILKNFMYVAEVAHGRDLRCITLESSDLADAVLQGVDLSWASLARSNLQRTDLRESNLKRSNLSGANLAMARLDGCDCSRADFTKANLDGTHFREGKLTGAVFVEAEVSRASFDSANLAKANFYKAKLEQANFFNADCNNCNFDTGALENLAAKPAKAWGLRYDLDPAEFEKQVGLRAITSRTTKKFKGLDVLLRANSVLNTDGNKPAASASESDSGPYFGAAPLGTRKFKVEDYEDPTGGSLDGGPAEGRPSETGSAQNEVRRPPPSGRRSGPPGRRRPPPRTQAMRPPRRPPPPGADPGATPARAIPRQTGPLRSPSGPQGRPTTAMRSPTGAMRAPQQGEGQTRASETSKWARPRTSSWKRPPAGATGAFAQAQASLPIAPLDPNAPEASADWAKAIGQLMQRRNAVTKIVVELGDKSLILFKKDED